MYSLMLYVIQGSWTPRYHAVMKHYTSCCTCSGIHTHDYVKLSAFYSSAALAWKASGCCAWWGAGLVWCRAPRKMRRWNPDHAASSLQERIQNQTEAPQREKKNAGLGVFLLCLQAEALCCLKRTARLKGLAWVYETFVTGRLTAHHMLVTETLKVQVAVLPSWVQLLFQSGWIYTVLIDVDYDMASRIDLRKLKKTFLCSQQRCSW